MIEPWLKSVPKVPKGCVIVVPSRGLVVALKNRALQAGMSLLGIHFWLPAELRRILGGEAASRDAMRLVAAVLAEKMEDISSTAGERQMAQAVARSPDAFLHAFEQLEQAGWNPAEHLSPGLREMAKAFGDRMARAGLRRSAELDRRIETDAPAHIGFSRLLIIGFDGAHWPQFPLLSSAARLAEAADIILTEPREEAREIDSLWIGSWEQEFAASIPVAGDDRPRPMSEVLRLPESKNEIERRIAEPAGCIDFLVGETAADLATVIAARVLEDLAESKSPRIAIVFPRASALSRLVSMRLADARIFHNDALGHPLADATEDPAWTAWLQLQEDRRVGPFVTFVEECRTVPHISDLGSRAVEQRLHRMLADLLIDDLPVLTEALSGREGEPLASSISAGLRELVWLPARAPIGEMVSLTLRAFAQLGWHAKAIDLRGAVMGWIGEVQGSISRIFWLQWIKEVLAFSERQRVIAGRHPYARVHLLSLADAAPLEWSHVILAGLNEGAWPLTPDDEGWLSEPEIVALNARARGLNVAAVEQGRHGEGHEAMRAGHTWCLTSGDLRAIVQRHFFSLMENTSGRVAATATLRSPESPERFSLPGEFFARLYFCARGRAVSPPIMSALQIETARWLESCPSWRVPPAEIDNVEETRFAWDARRKEGRKFGEYEFALKSPPKEPLSLTATDWETALKSPSHVFLDAFLNVSEPEDADPDFTARAIGTWVHRWLAKIGVATRDGTLHPIPSAAELEAVVRAAATADRDYVEALLARCGRQVPDWWRAIWGTASATAIVFARKIPVGADWTHFATEFRFDPLSVDFPDGKTLRLSGRIDLLLAQGVPDTTRLPEGMVWIVDYKTGEKKTLNVARLATGDGLQLGLYGLAARTLGAKHVHVSRIGRSLDLKSAQVTGEDLDSLESLWLGLIAMQNSGRFGMLGAIRSTYGPGVRFPLATLAIDPALLKAKWLHTHAIASEGGDE